MKRVTDWFSKIFGNKKEEPIGQVNFAWTLSNGSIIYQSVVFNINSTDTKRSVKIYGTPPEKYFVENHLFYHRVVVPFLEFMIVDDIVKFDTRENSIKSLELLSGKVDIVYPTGEDICSSPAPTVTKIEDNIIHIDFKKIDR